MAVTHGNNLTFRKVRLVASVDLSKAGLEEKQLRPLARSMLRVVERIRESLTG